MEIHLVQRFLHMQGVLGGHLHEAFAMAPQ
jgi:hypothetical protein